MLLKRVMSYFVWFRIRCRACPDSLFPPLIQHGALLMAMDFFVDLPIFWGKVFMQIVLRHEFFTVDYLKHINFKFLFNAAFYGD